MIVLGGFQDALCDSWWQRWHYLFPSQWYALSALACNVLQQSVAESPPTFCPIPGVLFCLAVCIGAPPSIANATWPGCANVTLVGQRCTGTCPAATPNGGASIACTNTGWDASSVVGRCAAEPGVCACQTEHQHCSWLVADEQIHRCCTNKWQPV